MSDILMVEDNPQDSELALRAFRKKNVASTVTVARDGVEALELLATIVAAGGRLPKVILLDLKLPRLDGLQVLERLKADPHLRMIPVVMLTSSAQESDVVRSYDLGANSYIVKPVEFENFVDSVAEVGLYWLLLNEAPRPEHLPG